MRWFVAFLVLANLVLFFWMQYARVSAPGHELPPPDIGRLRLLHELDQDRAAVANDAETVHLGLEERLGEARSEAYPALPLEPELVPAQLGEEDPGLEPSVVESVAPAQADDPATAAAEITASADSPDDSAPEPDPLPSADPDSGEPPRVDSASATTAAAPVQLRACVRVGPLDDDQAGRLIGALPADARLIKDETRATKAVDGYYVMIPPLPSAQAGRETLARLADAGITDTWLFPSGEFRNAISLGYFKREQSAQRHADQITRQGFNAEVLEKGTEVNRRWLLIELGDGPGVAERLVGSGTDATVEAEPCVPR